MVIWSWAVSEHDIEEHSVTGWRPQSPLSCSGDRKSYPKATLASVEHDHTTLTPCPYPNHEEKQVSLIINENQGRADQAKWTSCFCQHDSKTFGNIWVSLKTSSRCGVVTLAAPLCSRVCALRIYMPSDRGQGRHVYVIYVLLTIINDWSVDRLYFD